MICPPVLRFHTSQKLVTTIHAEFDEKTLEAVKRKSYSQNLAPKFLSNSLSAWETHVTINRVGEKQKMKLVFSDFVDKRRPIKSRFK